MAEIVKENLPALPEQKVQQSAHPPIRIRDLVSLSGRDALNYILNQAQPKAVVQSMSHVDFYWLVKQVGEEDALPLLRLASPEQWQHVLDMEIWDRDRISVQQSVAWMMRLLEADPRALVSWLYGGGELLGYHFFLHNIQVEVKMGEDELDLSEDFFTLDNIYYVRVVDKEHEETIGNLLRQMATVDYHKYQALVLSLAGTIPAEVEEELYRIRNVRLAEDGFIPFEEAASLYSYIKPDAVARSCPAYLLDLPIDPEITAVPMIPLSHAGGYGLFVEAAERIPDPAFLDRLRLEFAGLCNQMVSADQIRISGMEVLLETCRKAGGYLNIGLEELAAGKPGSAEDLLRLHPLVLFFQVGFSLTLELKWETERWIKQAWAGSMSFDFGFWGDEWGGTLEGILRKRPLYCPHKEGGDLRSFESLAEVLRCRDTLRQVFAVDKLLRALYARHPSRMVKDPVVTFQSLLFTFWSRKRLELDLGFEPITLAQLKSFFGKIRKGKNKPPFGMEEYRKVFIDNLLQSAGEELADVEQATLRTTLSRLWDEFCEDYAGVALSDMESRFSRFILIQPESTDILH